MIIYIFSKQKENVNGMKLSMRKKNYVIAVSIYLYDLNDAKSISHSFLSDMNLEE